MTLLLSILKAKGVDTMNKDNKPYEFPQECPSRDQKFDKGVIIDVVENEITPRKAEQSTLEQNTLGYKGKQSLN